jgi:hypothetical protein
VPRKVAEITKVIEADGVHTWRSSGAVTAFTSTRPCQGARPS